MSIETEVHINAKPEKVWQVFTCFADYPSWNPFIKSIERKVAEGQKIKVRIEPPGGRGASFYPRVLSYKPNKELSWLGHLLFKGIFDGAHCFQLVDNLDGTTTFKQSEKFSGILVPLFKKQISVNTKNGFVQMNQKLKELAER